MATTATTHVNQETAFTPTLFLAFELGMNKGVDMYGPAVDVKKKSPVKRAVQMPSCIRIWIPPDLQVENA
jgi:hypothetical protein